MDFSALLKFISLFGDLHFLAAGVALAFSLLFFSLDQGKEAIFTLLAAFSVIYSTALKFIFNKPRQEGFTPTHTYFANHLSFPSSHTTFYTAFFGYLLYICITKPFLHPIARVILGLVSILFISLIGISRVSLGAHTVKDVVAGYIFGAIYLAIIIFVDIKK